MLLTSSLHYPIFSRASGKGQLVHTGETGGSGHRSVCSSGCAAWLHHHTERAVRHSQAGCSLLSRLSYIYSSHIHFQSRGMVFWKGTNAWIRLLIPKGTFPRSWSSDMVICRETESFWTSWILIARTCGSKGHSCLLQPRWNHEVILSRGARVQVLQCLSQGVWAGPCPSP